MYPILTFTGRGVYSLLFQYIFIYKKLDPFYKEINPDKIGNKSIFESQISKTKYKALQNTCQLAYIGVCAFFSN